MKWEKIIIAAVSVAFAAILYLLFPLESNKYRLQEEEVRSYGDMFTVLYSDLDSDGNAEFIRCKKEIPAPAIVVQRFHYQVINQWNLEGDWVRWSEVQITDVDHDGFKEIVGFTYHNDSVWIHVIEALQEDGILIHKAIDKVQLYNGNQDWRVNMTVQEDRDRNDMDKCIISIRSGFTLQPRRLYIFNPADGFVQTHSLQAWNMISEPSVVDLDMDGNYEITGSCSAPGNVRDPFVPYTDTCAWFMIFDQDLRFKVPPRSYQGTPSYLRVLPLNLENRQLLLTLHFTKTSSGTRNLFELWEWKNDSLACIRSREFLLHERMELVSADPKKNGCFYVSCMDELIKFNLLFEEERKLKLENGGAWNLHYSIDVDGDGREENIVYSKNAYISVLRSDLNNPVSLDLGYQLHSPSISCFTQNGTQYINVFRDNQSILLSYSRNPLYPFRVLIFALSFLAYYFIFSLLFRFQRKRIEKRRASESQVLHYQLANVMQQLDPHFLFNALTNISSYYHKGEKEHAQNYLAKLSKLIRSSLENSEKMTISLKDELRFVEDYLYVESIRMGDRFNYTIDVDEEISEGVQIPKMLIQNFVENALKHGIRHLTMRKGMLHIYSSPENGYLQLYVKDNGIGRAKAMELGSRGTGNGMRMIDRTLDIYEKLQSIRISYKIEDLYDDSGTASGTCVLIEIPIGK